MIKFFSYSLNIVLFIVVFFLLKSVSGYKETFRQTGLLRSWPISKVQIDSFDSRFESEEYGPSKNTEVFFIGSHGTRGSISDFETWILCNFAKSSLNIFEFGTFTGKTTYLLAKNAPKNCNVFTLTLSPQDCVDYRQSEEDDQKDTKAAIDESLFTKFYYTDTDISHKIKQIFCDSKKFDEGPFLNKMDLIFIDGSHAQSYVESDTQKALKMIKPGGIIIWHDYRGPNRAPGVFKTLNKLNVKLHLVHICGTSFVAYKHPVCDVK